MTEVNLEAWNKLSDLEKAKYFASVGDSNSVMSMTLWGVFDELPEAEQRKIVAQAFTESANLRDRQAARGIYPKIAWEDPEAALAIANFSSNQRARGTEILWNPEGENLKNQIRGFQKKK